MYWGIISTGLINLIATIASMKLVERFGRRPLILYPLIIITIIMILLCIIIEIHIRMLLLCCDNKHFILKIILAIASLILTLLFISVFAIGLGPIPYVYPNEVFTINMRPTALSLSIFTNWLCNTGKYSLLIKLIIIIK